MKNKERIKNDKKEYLNEVLKIIETIDVDRIIKWCVKIDKVSF